MELTILAASAAGAAALSVPLVKAKRRIELSMAKHRSLAGHARLARRVASVIPFYEYDEHRFFRSDNPPENIAQPATDWVSAARLDLSRSIPADQRSDGPGAERRLRSCNSPRPTGFRSSIAAMSVEHLAAGSVLESSDGVTVSDIDGNVLYDVANSYGVNLFGYDFYKECIARGAERVRDLGPVLGAYHPIVAYNIERIRQISGLDEVSFHMSGTEAVMQAVRLARYHTRRSHLVRFCGAYHGWWSDVQPGIGNPSAVRETYTLAEMSEHTLQVLRTRRDIACVLVNPLQAMHPNSGPPADSSLVDSGRAAHFDRAGLYALAATTSRGVHRAQDRFDLR